MEIKIEKLPLMGSPFSIKTKKQGRRKSIERILKEKPKKTKRSFIEKALPGYRGENKFLLSIKDQLLANGINGLSHKQVAVAEKVFRTLRPSTIRDAQELSKTYKKIINH